MHKHRKNYGLVMGDGDAHFELAYCVENFEGLSHIHEVIRVIQIQK